MTKKELLKAVKAETGVDGKTVDSVLDSILKNIIEGCKAENTVAISGFGVFTLKVRAARNGVNPKTKAPIKIKESKLITFKLYPKVKDSLQ